MSKTIKRCLFIAVPVLLLLAALLVGRKVLSRVTATGTLLTPTQQNIVIPMDLNYYLQTDPVWSDDKLGSSTYTMKSSGCLVTAMACLMNTYGITTTPGELNTLFSQNQVYNSSGDVVWGAISTAYPNLKAEFPGTVNANDIEKAITDGQYPLVKVKYNGSGYWHWVLLVGADERGYLCMDPLYEKTEARPLSDHGGIVYSYRLVLSVESDQIN